MCCLGIAGRGRDQDGMTGPLPADHVKGGVVLGDDKHLVLMLLPGNANQLIRFGVQKRLEERSAEVVI